MVIVIFLLSLIAIHGTHYLVIKKNFHSVRASSMMTLLFIGLTTLLKIESVYLYQAAFFGGTFIGMSDSKRLTRLELTLAGLIFSLIFTYLIHYLTGIGGALGFSAFASCLVIYLIKTTYSNN